MEQSPKKFRVQKSALTLDQLLAFDVDHYNSEKERVMTSLANFCEDPKVLETVLVTKVVPTCKLINTWLKLFDGNMRHADMRLKGALKARVCYAEQGMSLMMQLCKEMEEVKKVVLSSEEVGVVMIYNLLNQLRTIVKEDQPQKGLSFMMVYLTTLTDVTPVELRSSNTPLTTRNISRMNDILNKI